MYAIVGTRVHRDNNFEIGSNHAALQGSQPVLLVIKKNGPVLRRLLRWLEEAPPQVLKQLPVLVIDDEADQASVDTRGTYQVEDDTPDPDYELPSVINGLIRDLLHRFDRRSYVAYTATPYANILIPHDTSDPRVKNDLYPKDFIVDLPKPPGYFGAEEFFGRMDSEGGGKVGGLKVLERVSDEDIAALEHATAPTSLENALFDFMLAGSARAARGDASAPATMLIHTSQLVVVQGHLKSVVTTQFADLRDAWRYHRNHGIRSTLKAKWETQFMPLTRDLFPERAMSFEAMEPAIGPFLEQVQVREINSSTGEVLDYEREPSLKAIAVGGNRLSRGLTLEGLLVSFFIRRSVNYDTLMQMGRWFGFRSGYEDLTRIWTTDELANWFSDLAFVEHRLREDIQVYESQGLSPYELGMRIWQHPTMQVTSPLKRRFASSTTISQSYSLSLEQTFKFPLRRPDDLAAQADANRLAVRNLVRRVGEPSATQWSESGPVWLKVSPDLVIAFLQEYRVDTVARSISVPLIVAYIERLRDAGELVSWTIAVRGRQTVDPLLGTTDWNLPKGEIGQISRSRLGDTDSVGVITSPGDEAVGLSADELAEANAKVAEAEGKDEKRSANTAARSSRSPSNGLLLLYPISRYSGNEVGGSNSRRPLYDDPGAQNVRDLVGLALSFPQSKQPQMVQAYMEGTVGWRPVE